MRESRLFSAPLGSITNIQDKQAMLLLFSEINNFADFSPQKFEHKETLQDIADRL